ncbi:hypothetical protein [Streptomyces sp. NPDC007984]
MSGSRARRIPAGRGPSRLAEPGSAPLTRWPARRTATTLAGPVHINHHQ